MTSGLPTGSGPNALASVGPSLSAHSRYAATLGVPPPVATTKRIADPIYGRKLQVFDQRGEMGNIIIDGPIARALTVPPAVVSERPERLRDLRRHDIPVVMIQQ
jgi:hypothetical protein